MTIEVEMVVDGGVVGDKLLQRRRSSESLHESFPSSERLMGIFARLFSHLVVSWRPAIQRSK